MNKYYINDIWIWAADVRFLEEVIRRKEYEFLFKYDTVVDLGANVGAFTFWIYSYARRIYSVEPNPKPMRLLQQTKKDNNLTKIIDVEAAITGTDGERLLINTEDPTYGAGTINDKGGLTVKSMTLETFMKKEDIKYIDLLKVDIEWSELELFESEGFKNVADKIGTIIGEYHNDDINKKIGAYIEGAGFRYIDITGSGASGKFIARK